MKAHAKRILHWRLLALLRALRPRTWRDAKSIGRLPSYLRMLHVRETPRGAVGKPVKLRVAALGYAPVAVRPGTTDLEVLWGTISGEFHLPPAGVEPRVVWDLGANVGLTMAHFLAVFPDARVVGVEPVPEAVALARRNVERWRDRATVVEAAVWYEDGELQLSVEAGDEWGAHVAAGEGSSGPVPARSLNTLLADEDAVDFLKMDVEGAEREILTRNTDWTRKVACIKVELHGDYTHEACIADLRRLGFEAEPDPRHNRCVVGRRA
jgi:FkbM family methyltransferase